MCDKFDRSVLLLLKQFETSKPKTIFEAINGIERKSLYSLSLSIRPPARYIRNELYESGCLLKKGDGYVISDKGQRLAQRLREITREPAVA